MSRGQLCALSRLLLTLLSMAKAALRSARLMGLKPDVAPYMPAAALDGGRPCSSGRVVRSHSVRGGEEDASDERGYSVNGFGFDEAKAEIVLEYPACPGWLLGVMTASSSSEAAGGSAWPLDGDGRSGSGSDCSQRVT